MSDGVIEWDAKYFKVHADHWRGISQDLQARKGEAEGAKAGEGALWGSLDPLFAVGHNDICDLIIKNLLGNGGPATEELATLLLGAGHDYVTWEGEAANLSDQQIQTILDKTGL